MCDFCHFGLILSAFCPRNTSHKLHYSMEINSWIQISHKILNSFNKFSNNHLGYFKRAAVFCRNKLIYSAVQFIYFLIPFRLYVENPCKHWKTPCNLLTANPKKSTVMWARVQTLGTNGSSAIVFYILFSASSILRLIRVTQPEERVGGRRVNIRILMYSQVDKTVTSHKLLRCKTVWQTRDSQV